jgi:serine/threonine protein kinase
LTGRDREGNVPPLRETREAIVLAAGTTFGPYQILGALGRGGMATVYKAYEPSLDRYVALKVLPRESIHDPGFAARFEREAKVIARLEHPNIIPIHNFGIEPASGMPWMAMRFISGGTLSVIIKGGPLAPARAIGILRGVADALDYAHGRGVIHRDVKPQNVLLDDAERVYLADFGIAKMVESAPGLTVAGMVTGTPQYMAPEQGMAKNIDHRVDIYALGIVAYEMLTGRVPFSADTPVAVLMKHVTGPIPVPSPEELPEVYTRALLKALAKKPEERWPSAGAFLQALQVGLGEALTAAAIPGLPTATLLPEVEAAAPTEVSPAPEALPTVVSTREAGAYSEPTLVMSGDSAATARTTPPPQPSLPATPSRLVSGLSVILGALAVILLVGIIGVAVLLWPRAPQGDEAAGPPAGTDSTLAPGGPALPTPMASQPGETPASAGDADSSVVVSTFPPASATPDTTPDTVAPSPVPFPTFEATATPAATPSMTPSVAPTRLPYREAGKTETGKDFFQKTLSFQRAGTVLFAAQVGPLRIPTVEFVTEEQDERADLRILFPVDCPKDAGAWDFVIRVYWLDENGKTLENDTDHESCEGAGVTSILQERNVPLARLAAIHGVRVRFEASPD